MPSIRGDSPELPSVYEPVHLESTGNLAEAAIEMAQGGAPEGTLVWTTNQKAGVGRLGQEWASPPDGLYAAVILRPDFDWSETGQIALVGLVSLGAAVAAMVGPMTQLRYRWPNDLLVGGTRIAGIWLHEDREAGWLTLVLACNVGTRPHGIFDGGCLLEEGGNPDIRPAQLLEQFSRQFLAWLNVWADEGMQPILRQLTGRIDPPGTPIALVVERNDKIAGTLDGVDSRGRLQLEVNGQRRTISIRRFLGLPQLTEDEA
ncbi:MAG TPA: biotin--[acetyl-CoA-carboxylase] ligase [Wenzhouxiangellaceae bacterium]|nr:biotin--[acetyl-CoA-carboxylase] ligase [Wenzhouxiangellaceae bacterium]